VHYWQHGRISTQIIKEYPFIVGHEAAGEIVEVGRNVTSVKPGQRVAIEPGITCGKCRWCKEGRENICPNVIFLGTPPVHGAMRETILTRATNVEPLPDSVSYEAAALCEPFGIGIHAARLAEVAEGETVAVFGAGSIGLSTAVGARCRGAGRVILAEPVADRRALAESMGFEAIDIDGDPVARIHEMTGGGVDVAFEAAGEPKAMDWATLAARLGGRACIIGIPVEDSVSLNIHKIRRAELTIYNCRRSNRTLATAVELVGGAGADILKICTHRFPLTDAQRAFEIASERKDGLVKGMLLYD
jgi:L-iditol 2-dehydrogenase